MGKRMDLKAYGKLNVILWEEFSYGKINVILWEKNALALKNCDVQYFTDFIAL